MIDSLKLLLRGFMVGLSAVGLLLSTANGGSAESYPDHPVRIILPYSAGSGADLVGRIIASKLTDVFKQNFIVENRPGTAGMAGVAAAAKSTPDGYTLLLTATQQVITPSLFKSMPYDIEKDLIPIARIAYHELVLAVPATLDVNSVQELVAYIKGHSGDMNYGSTGVGTSLHLAGAFFANLAGLHISHVPYSGTSQALIGLSRGEIQYMFYSQDQLMPFVQSGKIKLLASTGDSRPSWSAQLPTVKESGYPKFSLYSWHGLSAPAKTPKPIIDALDNALAKVLSDPDTKQKFERAGTSAAYLGQEEYRKFFHSEIARYRDIVLMAGVPQN